jgi:hypothetical protein
MRALSPLVPVNPRRARGEGQIFGSHQSLRHGCDSEASDFLEVGEVLLQQGLESHTPSWHLSPRGPRPARFTLADMTLRKR